MRRIFLLKGIHFMALQIEFSCPSTRPDQSPSKMAELQDKLDQLAQNLFGSRNKKLLAPEFVDGGPNVRFTVDGTGAYAELSLTAAGYWPTAIYELAHEIIHLLDPRPIPPVGKGASRFEEGLAVNFSLAVSQAIGDYPEMSEHLKDEKYKKYANAHQLFSRVGGDLYIRAREIRQQAGHFSDATAQNFISVSPKLHEHIAQKLAESFYEEKQK